MSEPMQPQPKWMLNAVKLGCPYLKRIPLGGGRKLFLVTPVKVRVDRLKAISRFALGAAVGFWAHEQIEQLYFKRKRTAKDNMLLDIFSDIQTSAEQFARGHDRLMHLTQRNQK